jgi:hypothetical protein
LRYLITNRVSGVGRRDVNGHRVTRRTVARLTPTPCFAALSVALASLLVFCVAPAVAAFSQRRQRGPSGTGVRAARAAAEQVAVPTPPLTGARVSYAADPVGVIGATCARHASGQSQFSLAGGKARAVHSLVFLVLRQIRRGDRERPRRAHER